MGLLGHVEAVLAQDIEGCEAGHDFCEAGHLEFEHGLARDQHPEGLLLEDDEAVGQDLALDFERQMQGRPVARNSPLTRLLKLDSHRPTLRQQRPQGGGLQPGLQAACRASRVVPALPGCPPLLFFGGVLALPLPGLVPGL